MNEAQQGPGWEDDSALATLELRCNPQHPHGSSPPSVSPVPGDLTTDGNLIDFSMMGIMP